MKHTPFTEAPKYNKGPGITVREYGGNDRLDGAHAEINGTYPSEVGAWAVNDECDMQFFVHAGEGKFEVRYEDKESGEYITRETKIALGERAAILVFMGQRYRIDGHGLEVFMASTPPWNPDQTRVVYE